MICRLLFLMFIPILFIDVLSVRISKPTTTESIDETLTESNSTESPSSLDISRSLSLSNSSSSEEETTTSESPSSLDISRSLSLSNSSSSSEEETTTSYPTTHYPTTPYPTTPYPTQYPTLYPSPEPTHYDLHPDYGNIGNGNDQYGSHGRYDGYGIPDGYSGEYERPNAPGSHGYDKFYNAPYGYGQPHNSRHGYYGYGSNYNSNQNQCNKFMHNGALYMKLQVLTGVFLRGMDWLSSDDIDLQTKGLDLWKQQLYPYMTDNFQMINSEMGILIKSKYDLINNALAVGQDRNNGAMSVESFPYFECEQHNNQVEMIMYFNAHERNENYILWFHCKMTFVFDYKRGTFLIHQFEFEDPLTDKM